MHSTDWLYGARAAVPKALRTGTGGILDLDLDSLFWLNDMVCTRHGHRQRQGERETERQRDRQTQTQTDRPTNRQTRRHTDEQDPVDLDSLFWLNDMVCTRHDGEREGEGETKRQSDRETDIQTDTHTHTHTDGY
eukprot:3442508-Rhodomonas_salina.4